MSCNNVQILNFNHNIVEVGSDNKLIITDNVKCNSIIIPQPVTSILQINSPGPQGIAGPSGSQGPAGPSVDTGSLLTTASFNSYTGSSTSQFAGTASFAITASYALFAANGGSSVDTGSLLTTASFNNYTSSTTSQFAGTASFATTASFALNGGVTSIVAGTGISTSSATGNVTITNTAPDQTVALGEGTGISISSAYPSFTITNNAPRIGPNYSQILFIFSQSGNNDPTFNGGDPLINTPSATFTFTIRGTGYYELASSTPIFTSGRTAVYLTPGYKIDTFTNNNRFSIWFEIVDTSTINIYSYDIGANAPADDVFEQATLDIKIY
jgi:hypothetical protein